MAERKICRWHVLLTCCIFVPAAFSLAALQQVTQAFGKEAPLAQAPLGASSVPQTAASLDRSTQQSGGDGSRRDDQSSVCPELIEDEEKPTAVCAKKAHKGDSDPVIRAGSGQTQVKQGTIEETPEIYLKTGQYDATASRVIHFTLAKNWLKYSSFKNFDRAGFLQIYLDVLGRRPGFPYFAGLRDSQRLRFMNFGKNGFFVGFAKASHKQATPSAFNFEESGLQFDAELEPNAGANGQGINGDLGQREGGRARPGGFVPFEDLEWGVTYLTPSTVLKPGFLRDDFVQNHGLSLARRSVQNLLKSGNSSENLRQGFLLVWSGGLGCLSQLDTKRQGGELSRAEDRLARGPQNVLPSWMKCDLDTVAKAREIDDLADDEQFFFLISGRPSVSGARFCKAVGVLEREGIESFGVTTGPKGRCVSYRTPFDDNWGTRSKLHCLLPAESKHLWANFDHVDFSFPTAHPDQFVMVESRFTPPRLTFVDLARAGYAPIRSRMASSVGGKLFDLRGMATEQSGFKGLPKGSYGMYQCLLEERGKNLRQLFFVPSEVYLGERVVDTQEDQVYSYFPAKDSLIGSQVLNWHDVMQQYPALDRFPEMSCAYELSVDVKCGIRVLQTVSQVVWEFRNGLFAKAVDPEVRIATLKILSSLLESLETKLPNWGMNPERRVLQDSLRLFLAREAKSADIKNLAVGRAEVRQRSEDDPWRHYLTLPVDFWAQLTSELR